jgi:hypothetical protein
MYPKNFQRKCSFVKSVPGRAGQLGVQQRPVDGAKRDLVAHAAVAQHVEAVVDQAAGTRPRDPRRRNTYTPGVNVMNRIYGDFVQFWVKKLGIFLKTNVTYYIMYIRHHY